MRLIDADALLKDITDYPYGYRGMIKDTIAKQPTVDPCKHGHWIDMADFESCSVCYGTHLKEYQTYYGKCLWVKSNYCPNCGAKMDEVTDEID